jgi:hypothetical protein
VTALKVPNGSLKHFTKCFIIAKHEFCDKFNIFSRKGIMKKSAYAIFILMVIYAVGSVAQDTDKIENSEKAIAALKTIPAVNGVTFLEGVWEDPETHDLHIIVKKGNKFAVESVASHGSDSKPVERMMIILNEWKNGSLRWGYYVPSTKYRVYFTAVNADKDEMQILWSNDDGTGGIRSGRERLSRMMALPDNGGTTPDEGTGAADVKRLFGKVYKIVGNEIIIASRKAGTSLHIGETVYLLIDGKKVFLEVIFPMQTVSKCKVKKESAKSFESIRTNMEVYK